MPVLLKSGQSASREEAAEKRKPRRSMQHSARQSMEIPDHPPVRSRVQIGSGTFRRNMVILESFGAFGGAELHIRVNQHPVADVMPVLLKSVQSASREEAAEKRKPRRSMQHSARRSMEIPDRGPCIYYDCVKPRSNSKLPE
ncbi:hypothetical protein F2Q70_00022230 [Brassica cretica]|uniref:Uncharacterized protein n=1 Tax=Brassica cretica TaxID=69181 RepID=A0A8S9GNN0_BRACR|nr:hypothetical protein F2Q70_00022230 [Brassica cretica]